MDHRGRCGNGCAEEGPVCGGRQSRFREPLQLAEKFGADDDRLAQSLNGLAEAYTQQEDFAGAASVYRRILSTRWSAGSNKGDLAVAGLVDRFSDVLSLAYFRGNQFDEALKKYQECAERKLPPAKHFTWR